MELGELTYIPETPGGHDLLAVRTLMLRNNRTHSLENQLILIRKDRSDDWDGQRAVQGGLCKQAEASRHQDLVFDLRN